MDNLLSFLRSKRFKFPLITALAYGVIYLVIRQFFFIGRTHHLYTLDWSAKNFLWLAVLISCVPMVFGWYRYGLISTLGYILGLVVGEVFGPAMRVLDPGLPPMPVHDGWIISILTFLGFCVVGIAYEIYLKKRGE